MPMREAIYNVVIIIIGLSGGLWASDYIMEKKKALWIDRALNKEGIKRWEHEQLKTRVEELEDYFSDLQFLEERQEP